MTPHSPASNRKAARTKRGCAYVLWGDGFDEVLAVTFVAELRKAGLQVKLVGLRQQPMAGAYGVILLPEIGLDEALAAQERLCCLVVPCDDVGWQRLQQEPRFCQLLVGCASTPIPLLSCRPTVACSFATFQQILITPSTEALWGQMAQVIATLKAVSKAG